VFDFDFQKNCIKKTKNVPTDIITWEDEVPRVAQSADGVDLVLYAPHMVKEAGQREVNNALETLARKVPPPQGKTQVTRGKPHLYKVVPGQRHGEHRLPRGWLPLGHNVSPSHRVSHTPSNACT